MTLKSPRLVQPLISDRVDLIGDIHGEVDALRQVLTRLGVDIERARVDRPLVFLGDLIDRGPDSVAVVEIVEHLVRSGVAQCVLGNHEFNVLRKKVKQGNGWFIPHEQLSPGREADGWPHGGGRVPFSSRTASESERARILQFIREMPLALESEQLRVVHAAWNPLAITSAKTAESLDDFLKSEMPSANKPVSQPAWEDAPTLSDMENPHQMPKYHSGLAEWMANHQNHSPIKILTSGPEQPIGTEKQPRYLSGKWRILERSPWWAKDEDPRAVIFGHYWRRRPDADLPGKAEIFGEASPWDWLGPHGQAFCLDYCVGYRFMARHQGKNISQTGALGVLRWPERELIFDDQEHWISTLSKGRGPF